VIGKVRTPFLLTVAEPVTPSATFNDFAAARKLAASATWVCLPVRFVRAATGAAGVEAAEGLVAVEAVLPELELPQAATPPSARMPVSARAAVRVGESMAKSLSIGCFLLLTGFRVEVAQRFALSANSLPGKVGTDLPYARRVTYATKPE
jgi:hypothetical protein